VEPTDRIRREPPKFRDLLVRRVEPLTPHMVRVVLGGPELSDFSLNEPAASVRVLLPPTPGADLVVPVWTGNEFLLSNGERPVIRTLTPRRFDASAGELEVQIVVHDGGAASRWVNAAAPGDSAAMSGPGRGYHIDPDAAGHLLVGDETAIPAIGQLLEWMPPAMAVEAHIEVGRREAELPLPVRGAAVITWHHRESGASPGDALVVAVGLATIADGWRIWAAGEAAAMYRIRHHLFDELGLSRARATVRGYWKHGRAGDAD
jgi:NADPH-dependent ferric siderophore reductase